MMGKIVRVWPILISLFFAAVTILNVKHKQEDQDVKLKDYDSRLVKVEMASVLIPGINERLDYLIKLQLQERRERRRNEER